MIIHPRLLKDHYKGKPRLELFRQGKERFSMPVGYNGNLFTKEDYKNFTEQFPQTEIFMFGRGIIANPGLLDEIRDGKAPDKKKLRAFHDCIYSQYQEILSGERNVLFRMKELWNYMAPEFSNYEKPAKKIKKSQHLHLFAVSGNSFRGKKCSLPNEGVVELHGAGVFQLREACKENKKITALQ